MNPIIMHINFGEMTYASYGKRSIDDICKLAAELGYDGIEFREEPPKELEHLSFSEYVQQVAAGKKKYGLNTILFCINLDQCTNPDAAARKANIAGAAEHAKIVNDLCDTTTCNCFASLIRSSIPTAPGAAYEFHGSAAATATDWQLTVESFQEFASKVEPLGMKFGFETHMNYIHDLPASSKKLVDLIGSPAIGINMDYGNTVYFPDKPSVTETIDIYGDKLFYLHLKNSSPIAGGRLATALSDGEINHRAYLEKLHEVGFCGPICIEAPRAGDRIWFAQDDFAYYKAVANYVASKEHLK